MRLPMADVYANPPPKSVKLDKTQNGRIAKTMQILSLVSWGGRGGDGPRHPLESGLRGAEGGSPTPRSAMGDELGAGSGGGFDEGGAGIGTQ